jgi:hypothetical protein
VSASALLPDGSSTDTAILYGCPVQFSEYIIWDRCSLCLKQQKVQRIQNLRSYEGKKRPVQEQNTLAALELIGLTYRVGPITAQPSFPDLKYNIARLRFDFGTIINKKPVLIECDDFSHYTDPDQMNRDAIKEEWCRKKKTPLIRIPANCQSVDRIYQYLV